MQLLRILALLICVLCLANGAFVDSFDDERNSLNLGDDNDNYYWQYNSDNKDKKADVDQEKEEGAETHGDKTITKDDKQQAVAETDKSVAETDKAAAEGEEQQQQQEDKRGANSEFRWITGGVMPKYAKKDFRFLTGGVGPIKKTNGNFRFLTGGVMPKMARKKRAAGGLVVLGSARSNQMGGGVLPMNIRFFNKRFDESPPFPDVYYGRLFN